MKSVLMLATDYNKMKAGWFTPYSWAMSIKFDGERAYWTGEKLISRYGNLIHAPQDWLDRWVVPGVALDGELYLGRGRFQDLRRIVSRTVNYVSWEEVEYKIFDQPQCGVGFSVTAPHINVTYTVPASWNEVITAMDAELDLGGEGVMLRRLGSYWVNKRTRDLVKVKPFNDDVGVVIGYNAGKGKYEGMLGSLQVAWNGTTFDLSGIRDDERWEHLWPIGSQIRFKYLSLTDAGKPREPRYMR